MRKTILIALIILKSLMPGTAIAWEVQDPCSSAILDQWVEEYEAQAEEASDAYLDGRSESEMAAMLSRLLRTESRLTKCPKRFYPARDSFLRQGKSTDTIPQVTAGVSLEVVRRREGIDLSDPGTFFRGKSYLLYKEASR